MNVYAHIAAWLTGIADHQAKIRTLRQLEAMSDSQLEDIGISRYQLAKGVHAFPWHFTEAMDEPTTGSVTSADNIARKSIPFYSHTVLSA